MPTEAELKLQAKYEAMRKAKEAKALKKKQAEAAAAAPDQQQQPHQQQDAHHQQPPHSSGPPDQQQQQAAQQKSTTGKGKAGTGSPSIKLKLISKAAAAAKKAQASATPAVAAAPAAPVETPREKAMRLLKEQREKKAQAAPAAAPVVEAEAPEASPAAFMIPKRQPTKQPQAELRDSREPAAAPQQATQGDAAPHDQHQKRPALKRPAAKPRPASATAAAAAAAVPKRKAAPVFAAQDTKRARTIEDESRAHRDAAEEARAATLFVGDLPHQYKSEQVEEVFNQFANVMDARVVGTQCYAFVRFESPEAARHVMETSSKTPIEVEGRQLRVNWAQGAMASWKQGSKLVPTKDGNSNSIGIESYEHPKVREARAAAQAQAQDMKREDLESLQLRPPPKRALVAYDDL